MIYPAVIYRNADKKVFGMFPGFPALGLDKEEALDKEHLDVLRNAPIELDQEAYTPKVSDKLNRRLINLIDFYTFLKKPTPKNPIDQTAFMTNGNTLIREVNIDPESRQDSDLIAQLDWSMIENEPIYLLGKTPWPSIDNTIPPLFQRETLVVDVATAPQEVKDEVTGCDPCKATEDEISGFAPCEATDEVAGCDPCEATEDNADEDDVQVDIRTYITTVYGEAYTDDWTAYAGKGLSAFINFKDGPSTDSYIKNGSRQEIFDQVAKDLVTQLRDNLRYNVAFPEPMLSTKVLRKRISRGRVMDVQFIPVTVNIDYLREHKDDENFDYKDALVFYDEPEPKEEHDPDDDCPYTDDRYIDFTIKCRMSHRIANCFVSMLKTLEFTSRHDVGPQIVGMVTPEEGHAHMTFDVEGFDAASCVPSYTLASPRTYREEFGDLIFDYDFQDGEGPKEDLESSKACKIKDVIDQDTGSPEHTESLRFLKTIQTLIDMGYNNDNWIKDGLKPKLFFRP